MSFELSKIIFSSFEAFIYLLTFTLILPKSKRVHVKYASLQFFIITIAAYLFLHDNLYAFLLFHSIIIFVIFVINKVDVYIASLTTIITYIIILLASLLAIIFSIFIFTAKYDFRFVLEGEDYKVYFIKLLITVVAINIYKIFNALFRRKVKLRQLNPRSVVLVNTISIVVYIYLSCELIKYLPTIFEAVLEIRSLSSLLYTGIFTAYIASGFMLYLINVYLFKSSDYLHVKMSAETDSMTGILNRKTGLTLLKNRMDHIKKRKGVLTICFIDVNNLKVVNDKFGHKEGDKLLKSLTHLIKKELRDIDEISRLGGDEFLVIFDGYFINQAINAWGKILEKIEIFNLESNLAYDISVSFGFTEYTHKMNISHELLIEIADLEMYKNKELYKNVRGKNFNGVWEN